MTGSSDDAKALSGDLLAPETVAAYLRRHPAFLNEHPDLLAALVPPEADHGDGVIDLQRFMLERLRAEIAQQRTRERALLAAAEANAAVRARIHQAVKVLLAARSFEHLIRIIADELPGVLDVAAAALGVENDAPLPAKARELGVVVLRPGTIDSLLARDQTIALYADSPGDTALFGPKAEGIRSIALMRLGFGPRAPAGVLALGSVAPDGFDRRQGTDLLAFLAHVIEHCIRRWLSLAP